MDFTVCPKRIVVSWAASEDFQQSAEVDTLASHIDSVSDSIHKVAQGAREADRIAHSVKEV